MRASWFLALCLALCACADNDEPEPSPAHNPYAYTRWIMQGVGQDRPTIEFTNSRASGTTGCNRWFAQAVAGESGLSFTAMGSTRRMCDSELMETENAFLSTLRDTRAARIEDDVLVLRDASGLELARFERLD